MATIFRCLDQRKVMLSRNAPTLFPRGDSRVRLTDVRGELGHSWPDVGDVFHSRKLRILRILVNTHIDECSSQLVYLGLAQQ